MSRNFLTTLRVVTLDSDPTGTSAGEVYFNSSLGVLRYFNGFSWVTVGQSLTDEYVVYSSEPPAAPFSGQIWVESDLDILTGGASLDIDGGAPTSTYSSIYDGGTPSTTTTTSTYDGGSA